MQAQSFCFKCATKNLESNFKTLAYQFNFTVTLEALRRLLFFLLSETTIVEVLIRVVCYAILNPLDVLTFHFGRFLVIKRNTSVS